MLDGSGSGKSSSYVYPNAYQMLGSYVFTDPKGEIYDTTAGYLQDHGYKIKVLNLVNPKNSDGYNPLAHIKSQVDVDIIAHTIVAGQNQEGGGKQDPYWDNTAEMLLKALIYYLISERPPEERNLASCAELVRAADSSGGSGMLHDLMETLDPRNPARTNYKNIANASEKTFGNILSTLQSKLGKFDSEEIANVTSTDTIDFEELAKEKCALYVMSSDTHSTYDFLLTIFFAQMIQQLYDYADQNGGKLDVPMYFILDEFANIGQIPDFDKKISTSRSRKISFSVILQNLDQLEAVYKESHETIVGNCDTHLFLGSNSFKTLEYFSKQLGETTISRDSVSTSTSKEHKTQGYNLSDQIMGRALMTPDEMRRMSPDECIIFVKGVRPIKCRKFYYFKHNMIKELAKVTIDHNNFDAAARGEWRLFNPFNPYVQEGDNSIAQDLKVESLDDLFADEPIAEKNTNIQELGQINEINQNVMENAVPSVNPQPISNSMGTIPNMEPEIKQEVNIPQPQQVVEETQSVYEPKQEEKEELFTEDLQKQLEAKFDELFGPIENGTNNKS